MTAPIPEPPPLRASVIVDYQNVHLTGAKLYYPNDPLHEHLVHPLHFANQMLTARNARQDPNRPEARRAMLVSVLVYRGLPSTDHDPTSAAFNLAHKSEWERDERVHVVHRPLKYLYEYDRDGRRASDASGKHIVKSKQEKGIDVLCALAVVSESRRQGVDLVILASQDTDLEPALVEARSLGKAKIETVSWWAPNQQRQSRELRVSPRLWNTRLDRSAFDKCVDRTVY